MKIVDAVKADHDAKDHKKIIFILRKDGVEPTSYRAHFQNADEIRIRVPDWESADRTTVHNRIVSATIRRFDPHGWLYILDSFGFGKVDPIPTGEWYWDCCFSKMLYSPSVKEMNAGDWTTPPEPTNPLAEGGSE